MAGVPPNFNPQPVDPKSRPKPSPPKFLKHQVYEDPSVFRRIDEHAIMVARYPHKNFRDLMWDLVYCANFTDLEKVRIIFRWMTAKNMYIIQFDQELPGTPEEVLTAFRRRKGTFAKILETMCTYAGLHCITVNGFAKGVDYHPGKIFTGTAYNHSWNAVNVAGSWQLVDAHWATRYLSSEKNLPENLVYEYDDFYFLMEPQQAVYSHFPEDSSWQLLPRPVNLAQYEDLPLAKSQFFKCYLDFLENNHGVVRTKDGKLQMTLAFWRPCTFTFKLAFVDTFSEEYRGQDLKNYVLQETTGNRINFFLRAPTKGEFYLTIYAQHIPEKLSIETTFRAAAEYKIICDKAAEDSHPYPKCSDTNWGPGYPVSQFDLIPNTKEGVITTQNGHADVGFYKNDPKVNLLAKLKKPGMDDQTLDRCIKEQDRGNECNFSVDLPQRGEYGLEIYANKPEDGTTYTHMCQYMLAYPDRPKDDKEFKENYALTPLTTAKPGSAQMIKPYGTYQPGTGSLAPDAGLEKKSPTKKGKKGPATAPKPGQQHAYEEDLPPPPPEFLQPMQDTEFQYVPRKDEPTSYQSLAAQAATGQMRPGDERMGPYQGQIQGQYRSPGEGQGRVPAGGPGSPGMEESISPEYAGAQQSAPGYDGYPGDRGSGYGSPGDCGSGYPGDRGSGYGSPGDRGSGYPGDRGSGYGSPGDRGSGYPGDRGSGYGSPSKGGAGSPQYGTVDTSAGPYPGYSGPAVTTEAQIEPNWTTTLNLELAPPEDFIPQKVESKTSSATHAAAPTPAPAPQAAEFKTQEVDDEQFKAVDRHAIEVSQMDHKNFRDLVWHLIYARNISDELEKARAIFLWLCTKDLNKVNFVNPAKDSPEEILMGLKSGKTTYAQIFETLCSYAGLHCVILTGFAKGAEYKPGMKFTGREGQHSWNAVLIHGVWRLVDCHWAARRLIGKHANVENVRYELDLYYFGPNSAQLIYTHFPDEQDWQLLKRPISQSEFEQLAPVKSAFFKYGLELKSHRQAVLDCNGEITLVITFPATRNDLAFTFSISTEDGQDVLNGMKLSQFGMQESQGSEAIFRLRFPESGSYKLLIYAKEVDHAHKDAVYGAVCEYRVDVRLPPGKTVVPYPPCPQTTWGPAEAASRYSFSPQQAGNVLQSFDGSAEIKFSMPHGVTLRFMAKLKSHGQPDADLEKCVMYRSVNDQAVFNITFPGKGEYGLEVYANDPEKDGNTLYHVWQYLIISEAAGSSRGIPLPPGYLGAQTSFAKLGLENISHTDPYITTTEGIVTINLRLSQQIRITTQLLYASDGASDDMSQYVLQQMQNDTLSFVCKLPKSGAYKLQIFALPYTDESPNLPGVYNYVIDTSGQAPDTLPFPKQFAQWKEGCFLTSPQTGHLDRSLERNGNVFFNVGVPKGNAVAVVVGEDWTQLDEKDGRWQGDVPFAEHWGNETKVSLCANFGSATASYSTLLEFSM